MAVTVDDAGWIEAGPFITDTYVRAQIEIGGNISVAVWNGEELLSVSLLGPLDAKRLGNWLIDMSAAGVAAVWEAKADRRG